MRKLRLVHPPDDPLFVREDGGRHGNILPRVGPALKEVQSREELALRVGEKREVGCQPLTVSRRDVGRVGAHREHPDTDLVQPPLKFLELPELASAEQSEMAPIEDVERRRASHQRARMEGPSFGIRKHEIRKPFTGLELQLLVRETAPRWQGIERRARALRFRRRGGRA